MMQLDKTDISGTGAERPGRGMPHMSADRLRAWHSTRRGRCAPGFAVGEANPVIKNVYVRSQIW